MDAPLRLEKIPSTSQSMVPAWVRRTLVVLATVMMSPVLVVAALVLAIALIFAAPLVPVWMHWVWLHSDPGAQARARSARPEAPRTAPAQVLHRAA